MIGGMDELPTIREHLPWSILFAVIGAACGIAESAWLRLHFPFWLMTSAVLATMGWGLGFDIANQRRLPKSKRRLWMFSVGAMLCFILMAVMCAGAGVFFTGEIAPRAP